MYTTVPVFPLSPFTFFVDYVVGLGFFHPLVTFLIGLKIFLLLAIYRPAVEGLEKVLFLLNNPIERPVFP